MMCRHFVAVTSRGVRCVHCGQRWRASLWDRFLSWVFRRAS